MTIAAWEALQPCCPTCRRVLLRPYYQLPYEDWPPVGAVVAVSCVPECGWAGLAKFERYQADIDTNPRSVPQ